MTENKPDIKHVNFLIGGYSRFENVALCTLFCIPIYRRVGNIHNLFGFTFKKEI
jgi:hypothetical protein